MKSAVAFAVVLCGCSHAHTQVDIHGGRSLAALLGVSLLIAAYEAEHAGFLADPRAVPELDPNRRVSEQDCTKSLDYSLGNIRCK
jgi:hypothetical protein